jgi:HicB family
MSTISLRLPDSLHKAVRELAKKKKISVNHFITLTWAEKMSALMTAEYLGARAKRGDRAKFEAAMSEVADIKPEEQDSL